MLTGLLTSVFSCKSDSRRLLVATLERVRPPVKQRQGLSSCLMDGEVVDRDYMCLLGPATLTARTAPAKPKPGVFLNTLLEEELLYATG